MAAFLIANVAGSQLNRSSYYAEQTELLDEKSYNLYT